MKTLIEVKVSDIVNSIDTLKEFILLPLKAKVAYHVARLTREIDKENVLFQERRNALIGKYAEKDEDGKVKVDEVGQMKVAPDNIEAFVKELNEVLETNVQLNVEKIKLDDLDCEINSQMMINLMPFIEVEE